MNDLQLEQGGSDAETVRNLAAALSHPNKAPGIGNYAVVPPGFQVESLELFQDRPNIVEGTPELHDIHSLSKYIQRFMTEATVAFADANELCIACCLDYHKGHSEASHGGHTASFAARRSDLWKPWQSINGRWIKQVDFIRFLEENAEVITKPGAADMQDLAMRFDVVRTVKFQSQNRLDNSTRKLVYSEDDTSKMEIPVPTLIEIFVPVFEGNEPEPIIARFRYKIEDGRLLISVQFDMIDRIERLAFKRCVDQLAVEVPSLTILNGQA